MHSRRNEADSLTRLVRQLELRLAIDRLADFGLLENDINLMQPSLLQTFSSSFTHLASRPKTHSYLDILSDTCNQRYLGPTSHPDKPTTLFLLDRTQDPTSISLAIISHTASAGDSDS